MGRKNLQNSNTTSFDSKDGSLAELQSGGAGPVRVAYRDFSGKASDMSQTGANKATKFIYGLICTEYMCTIMLTINLIPYLVGKLHLGVSYASNLTNYYTGTCFMVSVLGAFIADAYLGAYRTMLFSTVLFSMGLIVLIAVVTSPTLQPDGCVPTATSACEAAGGKIMVPTYIGLYLIAAGSGGIKPNVSAFGADQYDDVNPVEKKQSKYFFSANFLALQAGGVLALSLIVYLQDEVNRGWGYGIPLVLFLFAVFIFVLGAPRYRHKPVAGSFLVRILQVFLAAFRNRNVPYPQDNRDLWEIQSPDGYSAIQGTRKLPHSSKLRCLDKAATIPKDDCPTADHPNPWQLCTVTQVEETKRVLRMLPIWITTSVLYIFFAMLVSYSVLAAGTMDRNLSEHFVVPAGSTALFSFISSLIFIPVYTYVLIPVIRRFTGHPMGFSSLQRIGGGITIAIFACIVAALVEKKRIDEMRKRGLQSSPFGTFVLPLSMFYLLPQYFLAMIVEFLVLVGQLEFFYGETSDGVRSIGTSFTFSSVALGFYFSTVVVDALNSVSRKHYGGSWLEVKINDGGLEKTWYFLAVLLSIILLIYICLAHVYEYNPPATPVLDSSDIELAKRKHDERVQSGTERF